MVLESTIELSRAPTNQKVGNSGFFAKVDKHLPVLVGCYFGSLLLHILVGKV